MSMPTFPPPSASYAVLEEIASTLATMTKTLGHLVELVKIIEERGR